MIEDEVTECLRELIDLVGATSARIGAEVSDGVERSDIPPRIGGDANGVGRLDIPARIIPLGAGEYLRLELRARKPNVDVDAALEHAMRTLRTIRRRWEVARLPEVTVSADRTRGPTALERIQEYVGALAVIDRASNAFLVHRSDLIVAARPADEFEAMRWPLLARRIMSIHSPHSSHGELVEPDAFAMSFWYEIGRAHV